MARSSPASSSTASTGCCRCSRQIPKPRPPKPNVLIVAATNRADSLDPALLRPGRFDRRLTFDLPAKASRRQLIDHFLIKRSHGPELDDAEHRDALAAVTSGWSPAKLEHLLDEGLVNAVRRGDDADELEGRRGGSAHDRGRPRRPGRLHRARARS